jgi:hypothetical protein
VVIDGKKIHPRAEDFFSRGFVGTSQGDKNGYRYFWESSHENLVETEYISMDNKPVCIYCGERMLPIQGGLRHRIDSFDSHDRYRTTGYCCICDDAFKEVDYKKKLEEMKERHFQELEVLKDEKPEPNLKKLTKIRFEIMVKSLKGKELSLKDLRDKKR